MPERCGHHALNRLLRCPRSAALPSAQRLATAMSWQPAPLRQGAGSLTDALSDAAFGCSCSLLHARARSGSLFCFAVEQQTARGDAVKVLAPRGTAGRAAFMPIASPVLEPWYIVGLKSAVAICHASFGVVQSLISARALAAGARCSRGRGGCCAVITTAFS